MGFDPTKPVRTRDGRSARIICRDLSGGRPIVAAITQDGTEYVTTVQASGRFSGSDNVEDLINIPEKIEGYVNVYQREPESDRWAAVWPSREDANRAAYRTNTPRIACIKISFEEGQFDD